MKNIKLSMFALGMASICVISTASNAATITFNGEITASSCTATVDGNGGANTITLPTVSSSDFTGQTDGRTGFNISLTDCDVTTGQTVSAYFEPDGANIDATTGHLINTSTGAATTGVSLQLLDGKTMTAIKAGDASQVTDNAYVAPDEDGAATLPYYVEYYKMGAAVAAGKVTGKVTYSIIYK